MALGRNELCHCGSGKKYKNCCLQKDLEAERAKPAATEGEEAYQEKPEPAVPTWKIILFVELALLVVWVSFWLAFDAEKIGGVIFGCGSLFMIFFAAFRNLPTLRKEPGDAGNIDFGNRTGIQPAEKK